MDSQQSHCQRVYDITSLAVFMELKDLMAERTVDV